MDFKKIAELAFDMRDTDNKLNEIIASVESDRDVEALRHGAVMNGINYAGALLKKRFPMIPKNLIDWCMKQITRMAEDKLNKFREKVS